MAPKDNPASSAAPWTTTLIPGHVSSVKYRYEDPEVAAFCGEGGCRFTTDTSWIQDRRSPQLPGTMEFAADGQPPSCGGPCSKFQDCASDVSVPCRCKAGPSAHELLRSGYNPRYPSPRALCLGAVFLAAGLSSKVGLGLKGRDLEWNTGCPCNSTYVSRACCGSPNGIIWESLELKLGEL